MIAATVTLGFHRIAMARDYQRRPTRGGGAPAQNARTMAQPAGLLIAFAVFPLWVASGLADWACHRATRIATTSGLRENLLHLLMFAEMGIAVVAMALLEVNAAVLAIVAAAFLVHELTVWWDLRLSVPVREVRPIEQMVHSFQEVLPLAVLALLAVIGWDQLATPDWALRWKDEPLPPPLLAAGALLVLLFNALPLAQETWACLRARRAAA
jgi:hypothetical protein